MSETKTKARTDWWQRFCKLPRFSFLMGEGPSVRKVEDNVGGYLDHYDASAQVDAMLERIRSLEEQLENAPSLEAVPVEGKSIVVIRGVDHAAHWEQLAGLPDRLRAEGVADAVTLICLNGDQSLEALDEADMRRAGWVRPGAGPGVPDGWEFVYAGDGKVAVRQPSGYGVVVSDDTGASTAGIVLHRLVSDLLSGGAEAREVSVPEDVVSALDRMCQPLDPSVLRGATAESDAHCMRVIRDYVLGPAREVSNG